MTKLLVCALLAAGLAACGGSDSNNTTNTNTGTQTKTNTGPTGAFTASCMMVTQAGSGSTALTITMCVDYYGEDVASVQAACTSSPGDTMTMTYSAGHCPTTNLLGTCTHSITVSYYYAGGIDTKESDQSACTKNGNTWSDP